MRVRYLNMAFAVFLIAPLPLSSRALTLANKLEFVPPPREVVQEGTPTTLERLANIALSSHPLIKGKRADVESSAAGLKSARSQFFPTPYLRGEASGSGGVGVAAGVRQPLWTGGRLTAEIAISETVLRISEISVEEATIDIFHKVGMTWLDSQSSKVRLEAALASMGELKDLELTIQRRGATGYSPKVDENLILARLGQLETDIDKAKYDLSTSLSNLSKTVGKNLTVSDIEIEHNRTDCLIRDGDIDSAVNNNPTIKKAHANLDLARSKLELAKAQIMPTLNARAEYQNAKTTPGSSNGIKFFIGFDQSFGAGGSLYRNVEAAEASIYSASEMVEVARKEVESQIFSDLNSLESARKRAILYQKNVIDQNNVLQSYKRSFEIGRRSWLELLNATKEKSDAIQSLGRAKAELVFYQYRMCIHKGLI